MKLAHLHTYCQELEPALKFFTEGLNGVLVARRLMMGTPGAEIQIDGLTLFLKEVGKDWANATPTAEACGYNHLGFLVDNLDETLAKLLAMPGVRLDIEPFVIPARKRRCAFIAGPCELYVELMEDVKD